MSTGDLSAAAATDDGSERNPFRDAMRAAVGILANITIITALLVYFGWRRSETQAKRIGIDESLLGMSTREYLLRSVGPVLTLLVGVGILGLVGVAIDRRIVPLLRAQADAPPSKSSKWLLRLLAAAWLILPTAVWLLGFVWRTLAFVLFPASLGVGILLLLYAGHLRDLDTRLDRAARRRASATLAFGALLVGVFLFATASNYAEVEGVRLARQSARRIDRLPGVIAYSEHQLHLDGPGIVETQLSDDPQTEGVVRYRYTGLRLLEHTGGKVFLVSDEWTTTYGVVFIIRDDDKTVRLDFVRDRR